MHVCTWGEGVRDNATGVREDRLKLRSQKLEEPAKTPTTVRYYALRRAVWPARRTATGTPTAHDGTLGMAAIHTSSSRRVLTVLPPTANMSRMKQVRHSRIVGMARTLTSDA